MVRVLILTHGDLAESLLRTAETIAGQPPCVSALAFDWQAPLDELRPRLAETVRGLDEGQGVLILTDMHGDTPTNLALDLVHPGRVEVVTGVNLPMVLRLTCLGTVDRSLTELAHWIQAKGQGSILCTEQLPNRGGGSGSP